MPLYTYPVPEGRITLSGTRGLCVPGIPLTTVAGALTYTSGSIFYSPFVVRAPLLFDALACEVVTQQSGATIRMGVYVADTTWQPTTLIVDAGAADGSTQGVKIQSFTTLGLAPGLYLFAVQTNNSSVAIRVMRGGAPTGILSTINTTPWVGRLSVTGVAAPLANPGTAWTTTTAANAPVDYLCYLRQI